MAKTLEERLAEIPAAGGGGSLEERFKKFQDAQRQGLPPGLDTGSGAPLKVRLAVAIAPTPESRLETIRGYYPDARVVKTGGETLTKGGTSTYSPVKEHIIFTNPDTGKPTVFNPEGFDTGDLLELVPAGVRLAGNVIGGAAGAAGMGPVGVVPGSIAGEQAANYGMEKAGEAFLGTKDTRTMGEAALQRGVEAGAGLAMGVGGQALGALTGKASSEFGSLLRKRNLQPQGKGLPEVYSALERQGISTKGGAPLVTTSKRVNEYFDAMQYKPNTVNTMQSGMEETLGGTTKRLGDVVSGVGGATEKATAGEAVNVGLQGFESRTNSVASRLYARVKGLDALPIDIRAAKAEAAKIKASIESGPGETPAWINKLLDLPDEVPFSQAAAWRSDLGRIGRNTSETVAGQSRGAAERLTGVFDDSMEGSAKALAPDQFANWRKANDFYKSRAQQLKQTAKIANEDMPQLAFDRAFQGSKDGATRLAAVKKQIIQGSDETAWNDVVGMKLRDMATKNGEFDPKTFVTNWDGIKSAETKNVLFPVGSELRKNLDDLATIARRMKETNYGVKGSPTAPRLMFMEDLSKGGFVKGMIGGAKKKVESALNWGALSENGQAKIMTDPAFVKWLVDGQKVKPTDFKGIQAQIGKLTSLASSRPEIRAEVYTLLGQDPEQE